MSDDATILVQVDSTSQKLEPQLVNHSSQTEKIEQNAEEMNKSSNEIPVRLGTPSRDSLEQQSSENTQNMKSDDKQIAGNDDDKKKDNNIQPPSLFITPSMEIGNAYNANEKKKKQSGDYGYVAADGNDDENDEEEDEVVDETVQTQEEGKKEYASCLKSNNNPRTKNRMKRLEEGNVIVVHFDERVVVHTVPYWDPCGETYPYNEDDDDDDEPRGPNCCSIL